jgi:hypothetical protein
MYRLAVLLICALALAACGSDEPREAPWLPNFDTPEFASETYARAIETGDLDLAVLCIAPAERSENVVGYLRSILRGAEKDNHHIKVEYHDSHMLSETEAFTRVTYIVLNEQGEREKSGNAELVWVKQPNGTWRQSPMHRDAYAAARQAAEEQQAAEDAAEEADTEPEPETPPATDE